jgi:zinc transporter ZupT
MRNSGMAMALVATLAAALGAVLGLSLSGLRSSARRMVSFSGGLLASVALFGLLPEVGEEIGWSAAMLLLAAGYLMLMGIDRNVYAVCPSCSHDHDHTDCGSALHGFAVPLIIAAALHAFLDGWSIATSQSAAAAGLRVSLPLALSVHKIPEGIALGAILLASTSSRGRAFAWCMAAESATLLGAGAGLAMASRVSAHWLNYPLAAAGGCFLYLGYHAVHAEWLRRRSWTALLPGATGAAGAAVLQLAVAALSR